jgi:Uma2 family endonuclease
VIATRHLTEAEILSQADQRVFLHGINWWQYETFLAARGERSVPRMTYLRGALELMSPSGVHETWKTVIARLIEAYAEEAELPLDGHGSVTMKRVELDRGVEPDESYTLGPIKGDIVDLSIEVIKTSGGIDKLEIYAGLGVPEVWLYRDGRFELYLLREGTYQPATKSDLLPGLDLELLARFVRSTDQTGAVREFRAALREQAKQKKKTPSPRRKLKRER